MTMEDRHLNLLGADTEKHGEVGLNVTTSDNEEKHIQ